LFDPFSNFSSQDEFSINIKKQFFILEVIQPLSWLSFHSFHFPWVNTRGYSN